MRAWLSGSRHCSPRTPGRLLRASSGERAVALSSMGTSVSPLEKRIARDQLLFSHSRSILISQSKFDLLTHEFPQAASENYETFSRSLPSLLIVSWPQCLNIVIQFDPIQYPLSMAQRIFIKCRSNQSPIEITHQTCTQQLGRPFNPKSDYMRSAGDFQNPDANSKCHVLIDCAVANAGPDITEVPLSCYEAVTEGNGL